MKLLEFSAPAWCVPCRVLKPLVEKEVERLGVDFQFIDVDTDDGMILADMMKVKNVPTLIALDDSGQKEIGRDTGTTAWKNIENWSKI